MRQSSFRSGVTSPYREFSYVEFPHREIPYAPVQFQKWRHFSLQGIFLCRIPYAPVQFWEVAPLPYRKFFYREFLHREFPYNLQELFCFWPHSIENFPIENSLCDTISQRMFDFTSGATSGAERAASVVVALIRCQWQRNICRTQVPKTPAPVQLKKWRRQSVGSLLQL